MAFNLQSSKVIPGHYSAITEHAQTLHFPKSMILTTKPNHADVSSGEASYSPHLVKYTKKQERKMKEQLKELQKGHRFHVILQDDRVETRVTTVKK